MRPLVLAFLIGPVALAATAAQAQTLSWPGKAPAPAHLTAKAEAEAEAEAASGVRARAPVADARMVPASSLAPTRVEAPLRGLRPAPLLPLYGAAPGATATATPAAPASPVPSRPEPAPPPAPVPAAADVMAPRADAPVFRMDAPAEAPPSPPVSSSPSDSQTARYYSLHRPTGREPDAIPRPEPVYLDALPVELIDPPKSDDDMAAPSEATRVLRDANGRIVPETMQGDTW